MHFWYSKVEKVIILIDLNADPASNWGDILIYPLLFVVLDYSYTPPFKKL